MGRSSCFPLLFFCDLKVVTGGCDILSCNSCLATIIGSLRMTATYRGWKRKDRKLWSLREYQSHQNNCKTACLSTFSLESSRDILVKARINCACSQIFQNCCCVRGDILDVWLRSFGPYHGKEWELWRSLDRGMSCKICALKPWLGAVSRTG